MRRFEWTPHLEKFSEKSWRAFSSRNRTWKGVGSEEDALEQRGFQDGADLHLGAMCRLFEREKEKGRQTEKHHHKEYQIWKWKGMYAWTMHEHMICKGNCIIGSTQSNPNSTQVSTYKHTSIMHEKLWKCKRNAKHEHKTSYKQNPTQKFHKKLTDFQKPQKFQGNLKPRSKCVKCMKNDE